MRAVDVPAFEIDRLPYPHATGKAPRTGITAAQASSLCAAAGKRLCHELEWERACEGPQHQAYATGDTFDPVACSRDLEACPSPWGVLGLGAPQREWVSAGAAGPNAPQRVLLKGAPPSAGPGEHRCAHRYEIDPGDPSVAGVRCCAGPTPKLPYPEPDVTAPGTAALDISDSRLREVLQGIPELAAYAASFRSFRLDEAQQALTRAGRDTGLATRWTLAKTPFEWRPRAGDALWIISGTTGSHVLLAAVYPISKDRFLHATSLVIEQPTTLAVAYSSQYPHQLRWSSCWDCPGEGGTVELGVDGLPTLRYR